MTHIRSVVRDSVSLPQPTSSPGQTGTGRGAGSRHFVVFRIDQHYYALPLEQVSRALRMVSISPVPDAPSGVVGMINMAGQLVPVIDLREHFQLPPRPLAVSDRLLIVQSANETIALIADEVVHILELRGRPMEPLPAALADSRFLIGSIRHSDELVLVLNAHALLPHRPGAHTSL